MSKVCFAFQKAGHCNRGNKCKFDHVFSTTKSGGGGGKGGPLHAGEGAGAEIAGVIVEESSNKRVCSRSGTDESFVAIEDFDGSLGEGGGQVVRSTISFCQILGKPIRILNIRHKRSTPGLAAQHLEGLNLVTRVCKGRLDNGFVKSTEVTFLPPPPTDRVEIRGESFTADPGTAGAVTLMLQISLPGLAFFPSSTSSSSSSSHVSVRNPSSSVQLSLCGGTNVSTSPPVDHVQLVLLPILRRMGVFTEVQRVVRGYYPKGRGMMRLSISPVEALMPLQMVERGTVIAIRAILFGNVHTNEKKVIQEQLNCLLLKLCQSLGPNCNLTIDVEEDSNFDKNLKKTSIGVFLLATTDSGMLLPVDVLQQSQDGPVDVGALVTRLSDLIASGACVDEHTADQLVLYMALAAAYPPLPSSSPPPVAAVDNDAIDAGSSSIDYASKVSDHSLMDTKSVSNIAHDSGSLFSGGGVDVAASSSLKLGLEKELNLSKSRQSQMLCGPLSTISSQHLETVILVAQRFVGVQIAMTTLESGCRLITVSAAPATPASSFEKTDA